MNEFGKFIKKIRESKGWKLRDAGIACDLSHSYIENLEKGRDPRNGKPISPTITTIKKLAAGLEIDISELLKYTDIDIKDEIIIAEEGEVYIATDKESKRRYVEMEDDWIGDNLTPEDIKEIVNNHRRSVKIIESRKNKNNVV